MEAAALTAGRKKGRLLAASAPTSTAPATTGGGGWADLDEGLLLFVVNRLPSVVDFLAVAAVCRSWRALARPTASSSIRSGRPPLLLSPVLVPPDPPYSRPRCLSSPVDPAASYRCMIPPCLLASPLLGYSHGHLIFCLSCRPILADIATGDVLQPPELPRACRLQHGVLTAPLSASDCNLLLYNFGTVLFRWRVGEREWSELPLRADTVGMKRIMVFRGQMFTLDRQCRLFTVEFSPNFSVRQLTVQWPPESFDPSVALSLDRQLVECGGELMLVCFVATQSLFTAKIEVFRLDLSGPPSWVKMDSLGETTLFIDLEHGSSVSCSNTSRWGGRSNCIYLILPRFCTWIPVTLDGEAIKLCNAKSHGNISLPKRPSPIWVYPSMLY